MNIRNIAIAAAVFYMVMYLGDHMKSVSAATAPVSDATIAEAVKAAMTATAPTGGMNV